MSRLGASVHGTLIVALLGACGAPRTGPDAPPTEAPAGEEAMKTVEATLVVHTEPPGERPAGVWLEREDAPSLLAADWTETCWHPFAGFRVVVTGEPAPPEAGVPRFRIATLALADESDAPQALLNAVGPERTLTGTVETLAGEPGTKMEGSTWAAFISEDGTTWQIWDSPPDLPQDTPITITAREVTVSPYATHMPGPTLWIGGVRT